MLSFSIDVKAHLSYLCVKGIIGQLVNTLKLVSICLRHLEKIFRSLEYLCLIQPSILKPSHCGISNSFHKNICRPFPLRANPGAFLVICVLLDDKRQPNTFHFCVVQCVQRHILLQVMVAHSILIPFKKNFKLKLDCMVFFIDMNHF